MKLHDPAEGKAHSQVGPKRADKVQGKPRHAFHKADEKKYGGQKGKSGINDSGGFLDTPRDNRDPNKKPSVRQGGDSFDDIPGEKGHTGNRQDVQKNERGLWNRKEIKR